MTDMSRSAIRARWETFGGTPTRDIMHLLDKTAALERFVDERGAAVQAALAVLPDECWVFNSVDTRCTLLIGGAFPNGTVFTAEACCVPCRIRAALATHDPEDWISDPNLSPEDKLARFNSLNPQPTRGPNE